MLSIHMFCMKALSPGLFATQITRNELGWSLFISFEYRFWHLFQIIRIDFWKKKSRPLRRKVLQAGERFRGERPLGGMVVERVKTFTHSSLKIDTGDVPGAAAPGPPRGGEG